MRVSVGREGEPQRHVPGPGDLYGAGTGDKIVVSGTPNRERDFGHWSGAIGSAVLSGASVRRLP